jgi:aminoglycoside phosphotransferase (APT) family kinase protein
VAPRPRIGVSGRKPDVDGAAIEALARGVFGTSTPLSYERTAEGVSAQVYRVFRGPEVFYLRIAEDAGDNLETDAELFHRLRSLGVRVAGTVHVEPSNSDIGRSTLITTEVAGLSLAEVSSPTVAASVIEEAGADLALINQVPVDGFGFVRRIGRGWPLEAEYKDHVSFVVSFLPRPWPGPLAALFSSSVLAAIEGMLDQECARPRSHAVLAHGDFDLTQVFCAGGQYTGLIDFGEIRGAEPTFDLGHFHLHDHPIRLLPALLRGYGRIQELPAGHERSIARSAVLLGLRQLCRWLGPPRNAPPDDPGVKARARRIGELVAAAPR